jgi:hypothetical protein
MAKYKISLESEIRMSVKGITVKTESATATELVEGDMKDVARVMFNHEVNCMKINNIKKLTDNKLGEDVCSILTLTQVSERIG